MLLELERHPTAPNAGEMLVALGRHFAAAIKGDDFQQAMRILAGIVRCEQRVPAEQRRHFGVALKRLYSKPVLEQLAQRVTVPADHAEAVLALQGAGPDGVEVLLELLVAAPTIAERESVFRALTEMKEGADQLIRQLGHYQWYVVRNVAELVGELGLEEAVPALAKRLDHADERVRKAVGHALARIGTRAAAEPLRLVLRDRSPVVRLQAAAGIAGRKSNALVMMLVSLIEDEQDRDVQGELVQALGRIGTPDAIQALIKLSHQPTRFFKRTPPWVRVAAVEALAVAATPAAIGTLQGLSGDFDKSVRQAAQEALAARKR
jgi:HEAT repeat protein